MKILYLRDNQPNLHIHLTSSTHLYVCPSRTLSLYSLVRFDALFEEMILSWGGGGGGAISKKFCLNQNDSIVAAHDRVEIGLKKEKSLLPFVS